MDPAELAKLEKQVKLHQKGESVRSTNGRRQLHLLSSLRI